MSKLFRAVLSFPVMLVSIVAFWVFIAAGFSVWDADIWWHLRNAEYLFATGSTPHFDFYSYTTNSHPWMNHEWLAEIPYYLGWRAAGLLGIYLTFLTMLVLLQLGIFYLAYKRTGNLKGAFLVSCFAVFLTKVSYGPRTILFGYAFLIILLLLLGRYRETGKAPLWILPPLFCLWINTHGSWLLGLIMLGIYIVSGLVEGCWGRVDAVKWTPQQLKHLLAVTGASVAALFINPFTYRLVIYPFDLAFRQKLNIAYIDEWASVDFHDARGKVVLILLAAVLLGLLLSRCRWKLEEVLLGAFALYSGLMHIRFLFLAAILLAPMLTRLLDFIPPYRPEIDKPLLNAIVIAVLLVIAVRHVPTRSDLEDVVAKRFPVHALTFIKSHGLPGNVFNRYMWGGYLIFFCRDVKPFIDGRTDIFEYTGVLKDYLDAEQLKESLQIMDKYRIRYVLLPPDDPLAYLLKNNTGWKVIFTDDVTTIFERANLPQAAPAVALPAGGAP